MSVQVKKLTYKDYLQLTPSDSSNYQLIEGELITMTSPNIKHQRTILPLVRYLGEYIAKKQIGELFLAPMDVVLQEENVYQPDIFFISDERKNIIEETKINGIPDLIVEVLSPCNAYYDLVVKKRVYESCGVKEYWIVDPHLETLDLYILENSKLEHKLQIEKHGQVQSKIFHELNLDIIQLFEI